MRVFVTGATGFIGSAIVQELLAHGHTVLGLARSEGAAATLTQWGVQAHKGDLSDTDSLAAAAHACDGVIHMAFIHDFSRYEANAATDGLALSAMASALEGTDKPLVTTSVTTVLPPSRKGTELDAPALAGMASVRAVSEVVLAAAERGVRVSAVRLPPSVHDKGDHGFIPMLIDFARRTSVAAYVGDGSNCWPAVHRLDAARLYRLALEKAAPGTRLHAAAEEGIPMRAIAQAIGRGLGVPARSMTEDEAAAHFGWMAAFAAIDNPVSSALTRSTMGWQPQQAGLLADMQNSGYF
jgi:nucleoside-diphosphate-sugar epimerase